MSFFSVYMALNVTTRAKLNALNLLLCEEKSCIEFMNEQSVVLSKVKN